MTQKLSKDRLGRRNAHNANRIWTVSGWRKAFVKYTTCMRAWQLNLLFALLAKRAWLASSWKILVVEVSNAQEDWAENHSSRRSIFFSCAGSLPADVLWGSFVMHSFLPHGRNECLWHNSAMSRNKLSTHVTSLVLKALTLLGPNASRIRDRHA